MITLRLKRNWKIPTIRRDRTRPCPQQIWYKITFTDSRKGCPYGMILNSILIAPESSLVFVNYHGRSKPLPYTVRKKYTFTDNRIFSLPCVKGGAERTWGGGIVRLILCDFIKSLSHFFVPKKTTAPFTREPVFQQIFKLQQINGYKTVVFYIIS